MMHPNPSCFYLTLKWSELLIITEAILASIRVKNGARNCTGTVIA
jgi:hypothetical protein